MKLKKNKYVTKSIWELVTGWKQAGNFMTRISISGEYKTNNGMFNGKPYINEKTH
ncbi:MAG: hypothetical protein Unbinned6486contig1001_39 [Prokaryotic dsDNA virus sp.]|nr:MAG: hypothetical protein Unbinned6486contig1001_39 [Prokaryotic dsDNA virus sp.]|tara:strand:+ start:10271 stop:10435 length:165 start_codon:yes stop_codon:yes gene_type:complete